MWVQVVTLRSYVVKPLHLVPAFKNFSYVFVPGSGTRGALDVRQFMTTPSSHV